MRDLKMLIAKSVWSVCRCVCYVSLFSRWKNHHRKGECSLPLAKWSYLQVCLSDICCLISSTAWSFSFQSPHIASFPASSNISTSHESERCWRPSKINNLTGSDIWKLAKSPKRSLVESEALPFSQLLLCQWHGQQVGLQAFGPRLKKLSREVLKPKTLVLKVFAHFFGGKGANCDIKSMKILKCHYALNVDFFHPREKPKDAFEKRTKKKTWDPVTNNTSHLAKRSPSQLRVRGSAGRRGLQAQGRHFHPSLELGCLSWRWLGQTEY